MIITTDNKTMIMDTAGSPAVKEKKKKSKDKEKDLGQMQVTKASLPPSYSRSFLYIIIS